MRKAEIEKDELEDKFMNYGSETDEDEEDAAGKQWREELKQAQINIKLNEAKYDEERAKLKKIIKKVYAKFLKIKEKIQKEKRKIRNNEAKRDNIED